MSEIWLINVFEIWNQISHLQEGICFRYMNMFLLPLENLPFVFHFSFGLNSHKETIIDVVRPLIIWREVKHFMEWNFVNPDIFVPENISGLGRFPDYPQLLWQCGILFTALFVRIARFIGLTWSGLSKYHYKYHKQRMLEATHLRSYISCLLFFWRGNDSI